MADEIPNTVVWRAIAGFPDYEVSNDGRVRRVTPSGSTRWKNRPLPFELATPVVRGYLIVRLTSPDGEIKNVRLNRLVSIAFLPPPGPGETDAAHDDGDRSNNRASNLIWKTPLANTTDKRRHGTMLAGERHGRAKLTEAQVQSILARPQISAKALARELGVSDVLVGLIRRGKSWRSVARS